MGRERCALRAADSRANSSVVCSSDRMGIVSLRIVSNQSLLDRAYSFSFLSTSTYEYKTRLLLLLFTALNSSIFLPCPWTPRHTAPPSRSPQVHNIHHRAGSTEAPTSSVPPAKITAAFLSFSLPSIHTRYGLFMRYFIRFSVNCFHPSSSPKRGGFKVCTLTTHLGSRCVYRLVRPRSLLAVNSWHLCRSSVHVDHPVALLLQGHESRTSASIINAGKILSA